MKKLLLLALCAISFFLLAACAPGTSVQVNTPNDTMQLSAPGPNPLINQGDASGRVARAGAGFGPRQLVGARPQPVRWGTSP